MTFRRPVGRCALLLAVAVGGTPGLRFARAAAAAPPSAETPAAGSNEDARRLFAQGQIAYSLGEYDKAIIDFRRAYELSGAPGLLFNIAQAHRLNGDCKQALEVYRHFTRLVPDSEYRPEADTHVAALAVRCGGAVAPSAPVQRSKPAALGDLSSSPVVEARQADVARPRWSTPRKASVALLAGGIGMGLAAGGIYWWNDGRYDDWAAEDRRLGSAMAIAPDVWLAEQRRNDDLLRSIQRADTVNFALAGVAIASVVASAVLLLLSQR
jgi:tetratricopeptide (TPR) repeat protein